VSASKLGIVQLPEDDSYRLEKLLQVARESTPEELPNLIGQLESIKAIAWARLMTPTPAAQQHDELLDVATAAERLGISRDYLYRHSKEYAFTRHQGRKVLFSAQGIDRYIRQHKS